MDSARIWSQSAARRSIVGSERTHNPSPAAAAILKAQLGGKRLTRAAKFLRKRRRSFHRGNPAPAAILSVIGGIENVPLIGGLFKKPSEKVAASLAPAIVTSANAGNLTAARGLIERAAHPMIAKEKLVWMAAAGQLSPRVRAAVTKYAELIPAADQSNPKNFAASIQASPVSLAQIEQQAAAQVAQTKAERAAAAAAARAERGALLATAADVGVAGLQAFAGRGRRPSARRRRSSRRSRPRAPRLY